MMFRHGGSFSGFMNRQSAMFVFVQRMQISAKLENCCAGYCFIRVSGYFYLRVMDTFNKKFFAWRGNWYRSIVVSFPNGLA